MPVPTKDCDCEDFPCCEHADNYPVEDNPQMYYCDICGFSHVGQCPMERDYEEEIEGDALEDEYEPGHFVRHTPYGISEGF